MQVMTRDGTTQTLEPAEWDKETELKGTGFEGHPRPMIQILEMEARGRVLTQRESWAACAKEKTVSLYKIIDPGFTAPGNDI